VSLFLLGAVLPVRDRLQDVLQHGSLSLLVVNKLLWLFGRNNIHHDYPKSRGARTVLELKVQGGFNALMDLIEGLKSRVSLWHAVASWGIQ
jgi:hypothetical protein